MKSITFEQLYNRYRADIEGELQRYIPSKEGLLGQLYGMMRYHLGWTDERFHTVEAKGGKRIRPILCLAACESAGGDYAQALPAAVALELVHNYSLIHDDIEDRSSERRHRPAVWRLWGEAMAINVGDALFSLSRVALLDLIHTGSSAATVVDASRVFDKACAALCEGQHMDMAFENMPIVSASEYLEMIERKTGALIGASSQLGALAATGDPGIAENYREFGLLLGLAFQVQDDVLGIWGQPDITGKGATDIYQRKKTLPILFAMESGTSAERATLIDLFAQADLNDGQVASVVAILDRTGARQFADAEAQRYYQAAKQLLATRFTRQQAGYLAAIADFLIGRAT